MCKNNDLIIEKNFTLAIQNHKKNNLQIAKILYSDILKLNPDHLGSLNNLADLFNTLGEYQKAVSCYENIIKIDPKNVNTHYNLGVVFKELGELEKAKNCYERVIEIDPNHKLAHNNLGVIFKKLGELEKAKNCYERVIEIDPTYKNAYYNQGNIMHALGQNQKAISYYQKAIKIDPDDAFTYYNLGLIFKKLGEYQKAKKCYERAIEINPNYTHAIFNLGNAYIELGEVQKAKECYEEAIEINPNYTDSYWNLHALALNIDQALSILKKLHEIDNDHIKSKIMISALLGYKGNFNMFNELLTSSDFNHSYIRSVKWVFSLSKLPKIFFNRWDFFDTVVELSETTRPFYEFGVWNGASFRYLINTFKKGFGFDTFAGLPEAWHNEPEGTYSSFGVVPKIEGGEFIAGKFEDSLPGFFSKKKPMASLINFDADLYSSTLCALNNSNNVIDEKTILVFDEFIMNENWEEDEFKALNEFCNNLGYSYDVIAVSFFTKQVAVKLNKI